MTGALSGMGGQQGGGGNPFSAAPNPMGDFWGNSGDPSNPAVTAAQPAASAQTQQASAAPPPPAETPQQDQGSLLNSLNSILFGGSGQQHATEPVKYQASAGQGLGGGVSGEFPQQPLQPLPQAITTPGGVRADTTTGLPAEVATPRNISPSATVSPQSAPVSGNTPAVSAPATAAPAPAPAPAAAASAAPAASNYPDIAGSAREAGAGPPGTSADNPAFSSPPGGGLPPVLQDLLSLNFGRFIADLLGQQGMPQGQNLAGQPRPSAGTGNLPPEASAEAPPPANPLPGTPGGISPQTSAQFPPSAPAQSPTQTASAAPSPQQTASADRSVGNPMGDMGGTGGRPTQMAAAAPPAATPPGAPTPGTATAALPPPAAPMGTTPGGTPGGAAPSPQPIGGITQFGNVPALTQNDIQIGGVHRPPMKPSQPSVDRGTFKNEIQANKGGLPDGSAGSLMEQAAWMVNGEVLSGASVQARRVQLETAFNRAQMRGIPLSQALLPSLRAGDPGYYDGRKGLHAGTYRWSAKPTAAQLAQFKRDVWDPVVGGSNYSDVGWGPMTGNASANVAAHQFAKGTPGYRIRAGGDTYFREKPFKPLPALPATETATAAPTGIGSSSIRSGDEVNPALPPSTRPQTIDPRWGRTGVVHG